MVLAVSILVAVTLLFLFGFTILVIAIAGGLITFLANLFQGKRKPTTRPSAKAPYPPFHQKRPHKMDDDDVIDI